jgi:hypothetical protein
LKEEVDSKCRLCKQHEETIVHLTSWCPMLAKNEYLTRHYKVGAHLHHSILKALGTETTDNWRARTHTNWYVNMRIWQCYGIKGVYPQWKADNLSQLQEICSLLWNLKFNNHIQKSLSLVLF